MTTRRVFLSSVPAVAAVGGMGFTWAQRPVMVDPLVDAISRELFDAVRERPDMTTIKRAVKLFVVALEQSKLDKQIDALLARPDAVSWVMSTAHDHDRHAAERARLLQLAPEMVYIQPAMPDYSAADVNRAINVFRQQGFANTLRQMADTLPTSDDPTRLDWGCDAWGYSCLFWGVATIFICLVPSGWGCLLGFFLDQWICYMWTMCQP